MACTALHNRNDSPALILLFLIMSTLPKYVVLKSEFSSNLVVLNISGWNPSYTSKYPPFHCCGVSPKFNSNICLSFSSMFDSSVIILFIYSANIQILEIPWVFVILYVTDYIA